MDKFTARLVALIEKTLEDRLDAAIQRHAQRHHGELKADVEALVHAALEDALEGTLSDDPQVAVSERTSPKAAPKPRASRTGSTSILPNETRSEMMKRLRRDEPERWGSRKKTSGKTVPTVKSVEELPKESVNMPIDVSQPIETPSPAQVVQISATARPTALAGKLLESLVAGAKAAVVEVPEDIV